MILQVRRLLMKPDIIRLNRHRIKENDRKVFYNVVNATKLPADDQIVIDLYYAIKTGVRLLKTDNVTLLNLSPMIKNKFNLRIEKCD